MALITVIGVVSLVTLLTGHGDGSLVFSTAIELSYPPWLVWRLLDRETAAWFALAPGRGHTPRTSGWRWITVLAVWAVVWASWSRGRSHSDGPGTLPSNASSSIA